MPGPRVTVEPLDVAKWWPRVQTKVRRHPIRTDIGFALLLGSFSVLSNQDTAAESKRSVAAAKAAAAKAATTAVDASTAALAGQSSVKFGVIALVVAALSALPFALRRLAPFWSIVAAVGLPLLGWAVEVPDQVVSLLVGWFAVHAVAQYAQGRSLVWGRRLVALVFIAVTLVSIVLIATDANDITDRASRFRLLFFSLFGTVGMFGTAWLSGWLGRGRNDHVALLAQRAIELEERQDEQARQAVFDERVRIAREVHDVVAHHVSVMGVQAGAARMMLAKDPAKAEAVIGQIEASSRSAITDLSRLVMFLRESDDPTSSGVTDAPQPDLEQLPFLFDESRQAGMDLTVESTGSDIGVPASIGLCAYRIVQEALTNVRKHAGVTATTRVSLSYLSTGVEVIVQNRGRIGVSGGGTGHGVIGMRERVALLGGTLSVGQVPGGFRVRAWLPLQGNAATSSGDFDPASTDSQKIA
jgi:signal transduction histidine kinase